MTDSLITRNFSHACVAKKKNSKEREMSDRMVAWWRNGRTSDAAIKTE